MKICCTVCAREMDYTKDESAWVTANTPQGESMYACSSLCALRLGYTCATLGARPSKVPPPLEATHQPLLH